PGRIRSVFRATRSTARTAICCRRARYAQAPSWWREQARRPATAGPARIRSIAGFARSRRPPHPLPCFHDKAGKQRDLTLAVDPRIVRNAKQIGCPKRERKDFGFLPPDHHAQFWRIETELRRINASDLVIAQGPFRPRIAQKRERGLQPRLEPRRRVALRDAPAAVPAREAPLSGGGCGIDLPYLRGWDGEEPAGCEGRKTRSAPAAGEGKRREECDGDERRSGPGKTAHRRRHHMMLPAKATRPG